MEIPRLGLGTWQSTDPEKLEAAVIHSIEECGYRYIDTAHIYGNEAVIGAALQKIFAKGVIKRSDLFITTKLWFTNRRPEYVEPAIRISLANLQLDYVDLYLIHWPIAWVHLPDGNLFPKDSDGKPLRDSVDILDTWVAMEPLVQKMLTRFIGVSNFSIEMLERMQISPRVTIQPYTNQIEHSVYNQQLAMIQYCESRGIHVTSWSPLASARIGPNGVKIFEEPVLVEVARETGKTVTQVVLRYLLQLAPIVDVIPKSLTAAYIRQNSEIFDFELNTNQVEKIRKLNVGWRHQYGVEIAGYDILGLGL